MADLKGAAVVCDDKCGCPTPCPGGSVCRCYATTVKGGDVTVEHKRCSCGEHCGCNPCTCSGRVAPAAGCKCGSGCTCATCAA